MVFFLGNHHRFLSESLSGFTRRNRGVLAPPTPSRIPVSL